MSDFCEHCELPLAMCIHGNPPTPPPEPVRKTAAPRKSRAMATGTVPASSRSVRTTASAPPRRRTPAEELEPLVLSALGGLGGQAPADDVIDAVGVAMTEGELFRAGDQEQGPTGELRWRTACRTARKQLADAGRLVAPEPGVWRLVD